MRATSALRALLKGDGIVVVPGAHAYAAAGADVLFVEAPTSAEGAR